MVFMLGCASIRVGMKMNRERELGLFYMFLAHMRTSPHNTVLMLPVVICVCEPYI